MPWLLAHGHFLSLLPDLSPPAPPQRARLIGHRAAFAARSQQDWGTRANPAPMLTLVPGASSRAAAVELPPDSFEEALRRWSETEGGDRRVEADAEVGLPFRRDLTRVTFLTADPAGPHALKPLPLERLARMVLVARGRRGTGIEYLLGLNERLREWGFEEPAVAALLKEVQKERGEGWR